MYKLCALLLTVTILSLAGCTCAADPMCPNSKLPSYEIEDALSLLNAARMKAFKGDQRNGLSGINLPPAVSMPSMKWECNLEELALKDLKAVCDTSRIEKVQGKTYLRRSELSEVSLPRVILFYMAAAQYYSAFNDTDDDVKYSKEADLLVYAHLLREDAIKIGCARHFCKTEKSAFRYTTLCITDNVELKEKEVIYTVDKTKNACKDNLYLKNEVKASFLNMHNNLRAKLARGEVTNGPSGEKCRPASKMPKLVYDCALEKKAFERAQLCENFTPEGREEYSENSYFYTTNLDRTLVQGAEEAMQHWWSEIEKSLSFKVFQNMYYREQNINSFAKMASDSTTKIGCAMYHCVGRVNVVCRYETKLSNWQKLYTAGRTCKKCSSCTGDLCSPSTNELLL